MTPPRRLQALGSLAALLAATLPTHGATAAEPDISKWECRFCTFARGWHGSADAGLQLSDSSSFRYGEYSGLNDRGAHAELGGTALYRDAKGRYVDARADDLGLESRSISVAGGQQGRYELRADFQQIPQFRYDTASTPFSGHGNVLTLPGDWVSAGSTSGMASLPGDLHRIDIAGRRKIIALGAAMTPQNSPWHYQLDLRRDRVDGNTVTGASFLTSSMQLPLEQDQVTDQIEASIARAGRSWQLRFGYYGSYFRQDASALQWSNPYTAYNDATVGRTSVAPDNAFNQLSLSGAWQILPSTRATANFSYGRGTQDAQYLPATVNDSLDAISLPRQNLDGRVDTVNDIVRITSNPIRRLSLSAQYALDARQNHSPVDEYQQVVSDSYVGESRPNLPYSHRRQTAALNARYRLAPGVQLQAGAEHEQYDRDYQTVARTRTVTLWSGVRTTLFDRVDLDLKYRNEDRSIERRRQLDASWMLPDENPLLRRFDQADRDRHEVTASASYAPLQRVNLSLDFQWRDDDYADSRVGLTHAKDVVGTFSSGWTPTDAVRINAYVTLERIESAQAGSQSGSTPDWRGGDSDRLVSVGLDGEWRNVVADKLDLGAHYDYSRTRENVAIITGSADTAGFPANRTRFDNLRLYSRYRFGPRLSGTLTYAYQQLDSRDWALDGVEADTASNLLSLGIDSPDYQVNLFGFALQYTF